jgi:hypothetical protein
MEDLLTKLNYKGHNRIAIINAEDAFYNSLNQSLEDVIIDKEIDPRCPYGFMLLFVKDVSEVELLTPIAIHNLMTDGVLWLCYPKKTSKLHLSELSRDNGWKVLNDYGFYGIRIVSIDEDWSALRFRSVKFIKSRSDKYAR